MQACRISPFCNSQVFAGRGLIERLEKRELLSVAPVLPVQAVVAGDSGQALLQQLDHRNNIKSAFPIVINNVTAQNGQLIANGTIGANPFTAPITVSVVPSAAASTAGSVADPAATTQILNLHLGPINLNLLGLQVTTSPICLDVTATSGPGNLLGNLLTDVANLLNGGTPLGGILGGLTNTQLNTLLTGVTGLLNGVLGQLTAPSSIASPAPAAGTTTNILHLALGPVDLNLLGLGVHADNCSNGPITLDVNAVSGQGDLLGNLLTGLANSLNAVPNQSLAQRILDKTVRDVLSLV